MGLRASRPEPTPGEVVGGGRTTFAKSGHDSTAAEFSLPDKVLPVPFSIYRIFGSAAALVVVGATAPRLSAIREVAVATRSSTRTAILCVEWFCCGPALCCHSPQFPRNDFAAAYSPVALQPAICFKTTHVFAVGRHSAPLQMSTTTACTTVIASAFKASIFPGPVLGCW